MKALAANCSSERKEMKKKREGLQMSELNRNTESTSFCCEPKWKLILAKGSPAAAFFAYFFQLLEKSMKHAIDRTLILTRKQAKGNSNSAILA